MNANDVVGRKIVRVQQKRFWNDHTGSWAVQVDAFELDNGSVVTLHACESETEPFVECTVFKNVPASLKPGSPGDPKS